jgi:hypothetical protein
LLSSLLPLLLCWNLHHNLWPDELLRNKGYKPVSRLKCKKGNFTSLVLYLCFLQLFERSGTWDRVSVVAVVIISENGGKCQSRVMVTLHN